MDQLPLQFLMLILAGWMNRHQQAAMLDERYARGEVDRDEYLERRADLGEMKGIDLDKKRKKATCQVVGKIKPS